MNRTVFEEIKFSAQEFDEFLQKNKMLELRATGNVIYYENKKETVAMCIFNNAEYSYQILINQKYLNNN